MVRPSLKIDFIGIEFMILIDTSTNFLIQQILQNGFYKYDIPPTKRFLERNLHDHEWRVFKVIHIE